MFSTGESFAALSTLPWCIAAAAALIAAIWDVRTQRIPNILTLPLLVGGLAWSGWTGGAAGLTDALAGAGLLALPCFVLFVFAGGGAGDVKLLGALGSWLGLDNALLVLVCVAAAGVICGVATAIFRGKVRILFSNLSHILTGFALALGTRRMQVGRVMLPEEHRMQTMPYGVPICLGVWIAAGGQWLWAW